MKFIIHIIFIISVFLIGCIDLDMAYIPDKAMIEKHFNGFLSKPVEIQGIYGNHDVNAVLFKYTTQDDNAIKTITRNAKLKLWDIIRKTEIELDLYRKSTPNGERNGYVGSLGFVRIAFVVENHRVCVAWFDHSNEKWAAKHFWPKYEKCKRGKDMDLSSKNNT